MTDVSPVEALLKRDRAVVLASLAAATAVAWLWLVNMEMDMPGGMAGNEAAMVTGAMAADPPWSRAHFAAMFVMWAIMMVGMMLPGAAPMILLFAAVNRKKRERGQTFISTGIFAGGYLAAWAAFSLLATTMQWGLHEAALLSPMVASTSPVLGGLLFLAAGVYQWTPLKQVCLKYCRSPLDFIMRHWRTGSGGALVMGLEHGVYCVGCCWFLMGLLFVLGVMNLLWVAALTLLVLLEKVAPFGAWQARVTGAAMVASGTGLLIAA